jgi:hypothetical protein
MPKSLSPSMQTVSRKGYWREAEARLVVQAWRASGQSVEDFAAAHGLRGRRLSRWTRRLGQPRRRPSEPQTKPSPVKLHFHPVELVRGDQSVRDVAIEISLGEKWRVRVPSGFAAEDLERVLQLLAGRC